MRELEELRIAADQLVDAEDAINACPDCYPDAWCFKHAEEHGQAMFKLRLALGRPYQNPTEAEG
jgi:hypothetical protein